MTPIEKITLKNGFQVFVIPQVSRTLGAFAFFVRSGPKYENRDQNGYSHFLEHIILKGSADFKTEDEFYKQLELLGTNLNGWTTSEFAYFPVIVQKENLPAALESVSQALINPRFKEKEIANEKKVVLEEWRQYRNQKNEFLDPWQAMMHLAWNPHPLSQDILGEQNVINAITPESLKLFYENMYSAQNSILVVIGDVKKTDIESTLTVFENLPAAAEHTPSIPNSAFDGPKYTFTDKSDESSAQIVIAFKGGAIHGPDFETKRVLSSFLTNGWDSLLFKEIRRARGLVYSIWSEDVNLTDAGLFGIGFKCAPENGIAVVTEILKILSNLKTRSIKIELERAKAMLISSLAEREDNIGDHLRDTGYALLFRHHQELNETRKRIEAITEKDIMTFLRAHLSLENLHLVYIGPHATQQSKDMPAAIQKLEL